MKYNYRQSIKDIKKEIGMRGDDLSYELGMSHSYFRKSVADKGLLPVLWVRCFVIGYYLGKKIGLTKGGL